MELKDRWKIKKLCSVKPVKTGSILLKIGLTAG
jgi:hypothetical protein